MPQSCSSCDRNNKQNPSENWSENSTSRFQILDNLSITSLARSIYTDHLSYMSHKTATTVGYAQWLLVFKQMYTYPQHKNAYPKALRRPPCGTLRQTRRSETSRSSPARLWMMRTYLHISLGNPYDSQPTLCKSVPICAFGDSNSTHAYEIM